MPREKMEMRMIDDTTSRRVTFCKRRAELLKKAHELALLTDAQICLIIFSATGKLRKYISPNASMREIIDRYRKATNTHVEDLNSHQRMIKQLTVEDLTGLTINDLNQMEEQLEFSVTKIRTCKNQLLHQQLEDLHQKVATEKQQEEGWRGRMLREINLLETIDQSTHILSSDQLQPIQANLPEPNRKLKKETMEDLLKIHRMQNLIFFSN